MSPDTDDLNPKFPTKSTLIPGSTDNLLITERHLTCNTCNQLCTSRLDPSAATGPASALGRMAQSQHPACESTQHSRTNETTGKDCTAEAEEARKAVAHQRNVGRVPVDQQRFISELVENGEDEESIVLLSEAEFACMVSEGVRRCIGGHIQFIERARSG